MSLEHYSGLRERKSGDSLSPWEYTVHVEDSQVLAKEASARLVLAICGE